MKTIALKVTFENGKCLIDGKSEYEFEAGARYRLTAGQPLYVTWTPKSAGNDVKLSGVAKSVTLSNMTCEEHHRDMRDAMVFLQSLQQLTLEQHTPVWALGKQVREKRIRDIAHMTIAELSGDLFAPYLTVEASGSEEERYGLREKSSYTSVQNVAKYIGSRPESAVWTENDQYVALVVNGSRVANSDLSAVWYGNGGQHLLSWKNATVEGDTVVVKTDLMHYCDVNGQKVVEFVVPVRDDTCVFYVNDWMRSAEDAVGMSRLGYENRIAIRSLFDGYLLSKYPKVYELLRAYFDMQEMRGEPMGYLRNMDEYWWIDTMPEDMLKAELRKVFVPFDSVNEIVYVCDSVYGVVCV